MPEPGASEEEERAGDDCDHHSGAQVRLKHDQGADEPHHQHEWQDAERPVLDRVALRGQPGCHVNDHGELRELAGLHRRERADLDPTLRAVRLMAEARQQHEHQATDRGQHQQRAQAREVVVVDVHRHEQPEQPDPGHHRLPLRVVVGVARLRVGEGVRGGVDRDQPEDQQRQRRRQQPVVGCMPHRRGQPFARAGHQALNLATASRKATPRASKFGYASNEVPPGENRTTSPNSATAAAA